MKKFNVNIFIVVMATLVMFVGCTTKDGDNAKVLNKENDPFIQQAAALYSDAFKTILDDFSFFDSNISKIEELDSFLKSHEGYKFSTGHIYRKDSTLQIMNYVLYMHAYNNSNRCDLIYDYFNKIQSIGKSDYLVVDLNFNGKIYDSVMDKDKYQAMKVENYNTLIGMIGESSCFKCELQPDPEWVPDNECYIKVE